MVLKEADIKKITEFVKKEPKTIQEISKLIKRSWLTTDSYVKQIKERTGSINIKIFRGGTKGALKIAYYNSSDSLMTDELKDSLYHIIRSGISKYDFDFMEIFQHIPDKKKKVYLEEYKEDSEADTTRMVMFLRQAQSQVCFFTGNLSFINLKYKKKEIIDILEELLERKVRLKIISRINLATLSNITKISKLVNKYPELIEIKHKYHPLRGFVVDEKIARFKSEEKADTYQKGELHKNTRILYEIYDLDWVEWMQKLFWNLFRTSLDYKIRIKELKNIF